MKHHPLPACHRVDERAVDPHEATTHAAGHQLAHLCEQPPRRRHLGCPSHLERGALARDQEGFVSAFERLQCCLDARRTRRPRLRTLSAAVGAVGAVADLAEGIVGALHFGGELTASVLRRANASSASRCRWPIVRRESEASALISPTARRAA